MWQCCPRPLSSQPLGIKLNTLILDKLTFWPFRTCYACWRPPKTKEHVPPRAFFPAKKDLPAGIDFRKDLVTVASCDIHNAEKSKDDEYLLFAIVSNYETSPVAQHHFSTKVRRSIKRRPAIASFIKDGEPVIVDGQQTWMYYPDESRVDSTLQLMAKAIYFSHFGKKWRGPLIVTVPPFLRIRAAQSAEYAEKLSNAERFVLSWFSKVEKVGKNPQVFNYQIRSDDDSGEVMIRMVFYGFFSCFAHRRQPVDRAAKRLNDA